jgi:hypothetical protein
MSAGSSSEARAEGQTSAAGPKLMGCGCFVPSALAFLVGCVVLPLIVWGLLIPDWRANNRYVPAMCEVLDKRLDSKMFETVGHDGHAGPERPSYRPEIKIRYEVNGRKFEVWAYDAVGIYSPDRAAGQAIVDSFQVGLKYPCWYDPDRPEKAVLVQGHVWGAYAALSIPLGLLFVGGVGMGIAWKNWSSWPVRYAPGGAPRKARTASRFSPGLQLPASRGPAFNPAILGDPLALKTAWTPMKRGGLGMRSRKLVEADPDRLEFRTSSASYIVGVVLPLLFLSGPLTMLALGRLPATLNPALLVAIPIVLACVIGAGYGLYRMRTPIVFDRRSGFFWRGLAAPDDSSGEGALEVSARLRDIHALQLLRNSERGPNATAQLYELNLVLKDGERINVLAHGDPNGLLADASTLAAFLQKPIWNAM